MRHPLRVTSLAAIAVLFAACSAAAVPSPSPMPAPTPTPVPGGSGATGGLPGGGVIGAPGGGGIGGGVVPGGGDPGDPTLGQAQNVVPQPGTQDPHPVSVVRIRAAVDGHHVVIELRWWSGVAPCSILDSVKVERDGTTVTLTPMEGSGGGQVACIDIAQLKSTVVDLGDLDPGTYTIHASGNPEPTPIEVTVT
ncbi:MAG TPA: hypothetical protein VF484_11095 [Candidatus Limnocylindrales bacterium]